MGALRFDGELPAGDELAIVVDAAAGGLGACFIRCMVKRHLDDPDGSAIAECDSLDGGLAINSATRCTATFGSHVTQDWPIAKLWYDIQAVTGQNVYTLARGFFTMLPRITRTRRTTSDFSMPADAAALVLAAGDIVVTKQYTLHVDAAPLVLAAADVGLVRSYVMPAGVAALSLAAADVGLAYAAAGALDGIAAPIALWSTAGRMLSSYAGAVYKVRRASDNTTQDIAFVAATNRSDAAAQATFCGANNGFYDSIYDQSGNARHLLTDTVTDRQPKAYDSSTGALTLGGAQSAIYDNTNDQMVVTASMGMSGVVAVTLAFVWKPGTTVGPGAFAFGTAAAGQMFEVWGNGSATQFAININSARRVFTCPDYTASTSHSVVCTLAAGAGVGTAECYWNGVQLSQASVLNGSNTLTLGTTFAYSVAGLTRGTPLNGHLPAVGVWNSVLGSTDRARWYAMAQAYHGAP